MTCSYRGGCGGSWYIPEINAIPLWRKDPPLRSHKNHTGTSLVVQRLRIHLPIQGGTQVRSLIQVDPTRCVATEPMHPAPEPVFHSPCSTARETTAVEACTPQLD